MHLCNMRLLVPEIIYQNEDFIAISKPSGMLTLPDRHDEEAISLRGWMQERYGKIWVVHRLDKDTSGLLLFARNEIAHKFLSQLFENRQIEKKYIGLVVGRPAATQGHIEAPLAEHPAKNGTMLVYAKGKASHTEYRGLQHFSRYSLLSFTLHTGRTHQIRVHCKYAGHPIVCDPLYGDNKPILLSDFKKKFKLGKLEEKEKPLLDRLALHSHSLAFTYADGQSYLLEAPLLKDMRVTVQQLEKYDHNMLLPSKLS